VKAADFFYGDTIKLIFIHRQFERIASFLAALAAFLTLAMSFWITYDVLARNIFGISSPWSFDLSEYSLVWITFLGAPWILLQDRHVRIEILIDSVPIHVQRKIGILISFLAIVICAIFTWYTFIAAYGYWQNDIAMPRIWRIPRIWPYSIIPSGASLLTISFALRLGLYLTEKNPEKTLSNKASDGQNFVLEVEK
jgi:TRAP-type C4-dicarboxylate transport system permease small subunit